MNLMAGSFAHMANLLFPRGCAGCDKPDDVLCDACLASFDCELSQPLETAEMVDGSRADGIGVPPDSRFWHGKTTETRNATVRSRMRCAGLRNAPV